MYGSSMAEAEVANQKQQNTLKKQQQLVKYLTFGASWSLQDQPMENRVIQNAPKQRTRRDHV